MKKCNRWYWFLTDEFAKDIKTFRKGRGVSLRSFAKFLGISAAKLSRLERAAVEPDTCTYELFCTLMDCKTDRYIEVDRPSMVSVQKGMFQ